jgi:hypothetical protein
MCTVILIGGEFIGVDADDYMFCKETKMIRLFKNNKEVSRINADKIAGVVLNNRDVILGR